MYKLHNCPDKSQEAREAARFLALFVYRIGAYRTVSAGEPEDAIAQRIFAEYLADKSLKAIGKVLEADGITTQRFLKKC